MARLLLVDDDAAVRFVWEHVLFDAGHQVDSVDTMEAGCDLVARRDYDLVIADGKLGDGSGLAVADAARAHGFPALVVTGYAFTLHEPGVDLAQYDLLLKPLRPAELVEAVERVLAAANN